MVAVSSQSPDLSVYRRRLRCNVAGIDDIFPGCIEEARRLLTPAGIDAYLDAASTICNMGRGQELPLIFLQGMPLTARIAGEKMIPEVVEMTLFLSRSGNAGAIAAFLDRLPAVARRLETDELMLVYFDIVRQLAEQAPKGLPPLLSNVDALLGQVCIGGVLNWVDYGLRSYRNRLHEVASYFALQSADARAALQRERKGTLLVDHERELHMFLRAFWGLDEVLQPYSLAFDHERQPWPHLDKLGLHLPDVYDDLASVPSPSIPRAENAAVVTGLDRYRAALAHLAAHRLWTRPLIADNYNRYQHLIIEAFEDARVEWLAMRRYPGLRNLWLKLHPLPRAGDCPPGHSCIRHLAAMLSRALLDPRHPYTDPALLAMVERFHARMADDPHDASIVTDLGVDYLVQIHNVDFRSPKVFFRDTQVSYRDDNRYLWIFLEDTDEENDFHSDHQVANPRTLEDRTGMPYARHHPEWDHETRTYRPDWATVHESVQAPGPAGMIDQLLDKHAVLAKQLKRMVDLLKPQQHIRVRHQEDGAELDLDAAIRAAIDFRIGATPDLRFHMSMKPDGRDISVLVLLDLSQSVNDAVAGQAPPGGSTILELSREAVSLLGWTLDALGDPYAIAGFASNTRHDVRYFHFKGFGEPWGDEVKGRLAGMQGVLSTRMGTALRHAGHYLALRRSEKKLLLLLTDGEPSDIDVEDPEYLHADAHKAIEELAARGVATFCLSLDPHADQYVQRIFGRRYMVVDRIDRLPERLPRLYMELTH